MTMTREQLLAKCPKLAALRDDWFELAARVSLDERRAGEETGPLRPLQMAVRAQARFDATLDEVLEVVNGATVPKAPELAPVHGAVVIDGRVLCEFRKGGVEQPTTREA